MRKSAEKVLSWAGLEGAELGVLITGDRRMRTLNRRYRGMDRTTDVLSFSMSEAAKTGQVSPAVKVRGPSGPPVVLGDIVISAPRAAAQAAEAGHSTLDETLTLLVHGILHLLGYDHEAGGAESRRMERREKALLKLIKAR